MTGEIGKQAHAGIFVTLSICTSLVPRLSVQLFFARSKISAYFTTCEKKLDREPGNEATSALSRALLSSLSNSLSLLDLFSTPLGL